MSIPADRHIHECDCIDDNRCEYCGCCHHCDDKCRHLCKVTHAPAGMQCQDSMCGCVGAA